MAARAAIYGCWGKELTPTERAFFAEADPFGFILFLRNLETPDQIRRLVNSLRDAVSRNAPVLIDQEGGRVSRLLPPTWSAWDNALPYVQRYPQARRARAMFLRYRIIAAELTALGIDVNCAPMADIAHPDTHPEIHHRCYGEAAADVADIGRAVADGLAAGGVLPVLKHVPGHGRTPLDSHHELPVVDAPLQVLETEDFAPFRALSDLPMAMTAHIVFEALDPRAPVTLSPSAVAHIRDRIGFDGLLMTDDLSMEALSGTMGERAQAALGAGCDILLHCNAEMSEMMAVASNAPALEGRPGQRARAALEARRPGDDAELAELKSELAALDREARHA